MPEAPGHADCDYIVVGSGAGGGTVAARLAESGCSIILLEAGGDARNLTGPGTGRLPEDYDVPAFHPFASENPAMSWNMFVRHYDDPAQQALDPKLRPQGILYPRAGTLGGCTAHNAMITLWPHDADWDGIAALTGDASWRAEAMQLYIKRLENCRHRPLWRLLARVGIDPTGHGWNGWLPTEKAQPPQVWGDHALLLSLLTEAVREELGQPHWPRRLWRLLQGRADPNDRRLTHAGATGLCYTPLSTARHQRFGTRERLLAVAQGGNLRIELDALATRVILDERNRAIGVEYLKGRGLYRAGAAGDADGVSHRVLCAREVILSGGTFNTPQLLMLSGIGDPQALARHGITTCVALPEVGRNLQDRYEVSVVSRMAKDWRVLRGAKFERGDRLFGQWARRRQGMYVSNGAALAFSLRSDAGIVSPDVFCMALLARFEGYYPGYSAKIAAHHDYLSWTILKAHTTNRTGSVTLRTSDPRDPPEVDFRYFDPADGSDLTAVVGAVRTVRRMLEPLVANGLVDEEEPGTDVDIAAWVRARAWGHHASGTCAIGTVLDSKFRVLGVEGLRVVDASVFPRIPGFFIAGAIYLAAEKAAEVIKTAN